MGMRDYEQELFAQRTPYLHWLKEQGAEPGRQYGKQIRTLPFSSCMDGVQGQEEFCTDEVYLFARRDGMLESGAMAAFEEVFLADADTVLVYADEDYRGSLTELYGIEDDAFGEEVTLPYRVDGRCPDSAPCAYYRGAPWFKPDFSPDTLASFFYIGSVFAIRGSAIVEVIRKYGRDISIYEMVYRIFADALDRRSRGRAAGIVHLPRVLYTNNSLADAKRMERSDQIRTLYMTDECLGEETVSMIIPSKDHASVLKKCLETLTQYTAYSNYEIIIVDNGSNLEQQECITHMIHLLQQEKKGLIVRYLYQQKEFNFSAMCNAGARSAQGAYLLFLNDDIEVMDTDEGRHWLDRMMAYIRKSHVGAVGAKLYYPSRPGESGCYRIQHVGITNMGIGPAHKLGGMIDAGCLYHGHNMVNYDMLAVTAACMLIRKSVFDQAGGFDEKFPVAYNDVEFCFRLYQSGYFNVQVNEAVLIHHESLSRGQDTSPEKQKRLAAEKEKLYQKHPLFHARDPFYSPNLVQWEKDGEYHTGYLYDFDEQKKPALLGKDGKTGKRERAIRRKYEIRNFLYEKCRLAAKIYDRLTGYRDVMLHIDSVGYGDKIAADNVTIEGWYAVRNMDNADMPRKLWLMDTVCGCDDRRVYEFDIAPKLREDVAALLEGEDRNRTGNTALSGIQVNFRRSDVEPGTYRIGVCCQSRLICDPGKDVVISKDNRRM